MTPLGWFLVFIVIVYLILFSVWVFHPKRSLEKTLRYGSLENLKVEPNFPNSGDIPKIIHQVWIGFNGNVMPKSYIRYAEGCMKIHSDWQYKLWGEEECKELIDTHYPWFSEVYDNYDKTIKKIDAVRYFILFHHGGVYMDGDFICLKNIEELLVQNNAIFGYQYKNASVEAVCNAFMAAPQKHTLFYYIINTLKDTAKNSVSYATGPAFLTEMIRKYDRDDITIYPMPIIYPFQWNEKPTEDIDVDDFKSIYPNSYTATLWAGSWT